MSPKNKKIIAGLGIFVAVLVVSLILHSAEVLKSLNAKLSDGLYAGRTISDQIVIVKIDYKSFEEPEKGGLGAMKNWDASTYAKVLEEIEKGGPKVVMYDVLFASKSEGIKNAEILNIAKEHSDVTTFSSEVLNYLKEPHPNDQKFIDVLSKYKNDYILKMTSGDSQFIDGQLTYQGEILPQQMFADVANLGFANIVFGELSENDSTIYSIPYELNVAGTIEKHIDFKIAEDFSGKIAEPIVENDQMYINYAGKTGSFAGESFADVYNGKVSQDFFKNKIVLVGATAAIIQDTRYTPIDQKTPMPGIEIHANSIQTILDGVYLSHQSAVGFLAFTGLLIAIAVGAFMYVPVLYGLLVLIAEVGVFPLLAKFFFSQGIILDLIWPVFAIFASYLAVIAYRNFTEFAEKRKLRNAFAHYVSKDLIENVISNPDALKLGGDRREISVLFLDIENFTTLSESGAPEKVVEIINNYFDALSNLIMEEGGTVDKFEGDAIMALFGAPIAYPDHAVKACAAALKIREKMAELNTQFGCNLNVRVGVGTGDAIVGNMGSKERFDYTAMGDTVNTASRLEGINKFYKTRILVMHKTFVSAGGGFFFREVDTICPKGKSDPLQIHELMGVEVSEAGKKVVAIWDEALRAYRGANWSIAEAKLAEVLAILPEDGPSKTMLERIAEFKKTAPEKWDGVWRFKEK